MEGIEFERKNMKPYSSFDQEQDFEPIYKIDSEHMEKNMNLDNKFDLKGHLEAIAKEQYDNIENNEKPENNFDPYPFDDEVKPPYLSFEGFLEDIYRER